MSGVSSGTQPKRRKKLKKTPKKVLSLKKERMEIVYPNIEEKKNFGRECDEKKKTFDIAEINRH